MNRRQAQLFQLGWVADYPDAENFLQLFYSKNESPAPITRIIKMKNLTAYMR